MEVFDNPSHILNGDETGIQVVENLVQRAPVTLKVFQRHWSHSLQKRHRNASYLAILSQPKRT